MLLRKPFNTCLFLSRFRRCELTYRFGSPNPLTIDCFDLHWLYILPHVKIRKISQEEIDYASSKLRNVSLNEYLS